MSYFNAKNFKTSTFIKLLPDESVTGVFVGEPFAFKQRYKTKEYFPADAPILDVSVSFWINFIVYEKGSLNKKPKKLQLSVVTAETVDTRIEKRGKDALFTITRRGSDKQTKYDVEFERLLTPEECAEVAQVELIKFKLPDPKEEHDSGSYGK